MCGIFAAIVDPNSAFSTSHISAIRKVIEISQYLGVESEKRGKQSSGISVCTGFENHLFVSSAGFSDMLVSRKYDQFVSNLLRVQTKTEANIEKISVIGHARLVTHGIGLQPFNNQPISDERFTLVHNGIVTNAAALKAKYQLEPKTQVDSEIILLLIARYVKDGKELSPAINAAIRDLKGEINCLLQDTLTGDVYGFSNTGSLFYTEGGEGEACLVGSERSILKNVIKKIQGHKAEQRIKKARLNECIRFMSEAIDKKITKKRQANKINSGISTKIIDHRLEDEQKINSLRRCVKCILPSTYPGIYFDEKGVCNVCNDWQKPKLFENGEEQLIEIGKNLPKNADGQNCLVGFSGGRDSSFGLYKLKELGFKPIAYTYDWGMVTNLARRNQARMCGSLNIEHVWISANIPMKRRYVRQNLLAWLKRPSLGLIPLLMAGDKHLFWYTNRLKRETQLETSIFCGTEYEKTNFKAQFLKVANNSASIHQPNSLNFMSKVNMASKYGAEFILNPSYLNSSIPDTLTGYYSYYFLKQNNLPLFNFIKWDENEIENTLINKFDWEMSSDSPSSWRIGDATAPLYNFIYYTVAGFTEVDTFRSNQIRDGVLDRQDALTKARAENRPQWDNLKSYLDLINLDFTEIIPVIDNMKKLY